MNRTRKPYALEFDAALDLWHSGDPEAAIAQLEALAVRHPDEAAIHGVLGGYLWDQEGGEFRREWSNLVLQVEQQLGDE